MGIYLGDKTASVYLGTSTVTVPGAFIGGLQVFPTGPSVPGAPTINAASFSQGGTVITVTWPANNGGAAITGYRVYAGSSLVASGESGFFLPGFLTLSGDYTGQVLRVSAVNSAGEGPQSNPVTVTAA